MTFAPVGLTPLFGVFDMPTSLHFYQDILGFAVVAAYTQFDSNERPHRGDAARANAHGDTAFYIGCADIDAAFVDLTHRGLQAAAPARTAYGLREFGTKDPDGYAIVFQKIPKVAGTTD